MTTAESSQAMSMQFDAHVCLVSEQSTPNLIPALDRRTRPREVILVVSPGMRQRAVWLGDALRARSIAVSECAVVDAWNINEVRDALLDLLASRPGQRLALNVTGGTKPMAIAAQEVFQAERLPIFYVHPERNEILLLAKNAEPLVIQERVRLDEYLAAHGYRVLGRDAREFSDQHYALCDELVKEVERFDRPLGVVNEIAARARNGLFAAMAHARNDERVLEVVDKLV